MKRDHEILHYFYDNPSAATTSHPLVKNDMYGISHEVAYGQETLTKEQIKDMHDTWVAENEPQNHSTPMGGLTTSELAYKSRWDDVVIESPNTTLTKRDLYRYYANPSVKKKIFAQIKDAPVMMRQAMSPGENWIKRNPTIRKNVNDAADPEDLQYYIERRHVEYHTTMPKLTEKIVIDLDPGEGLALDDVKQVAKYLVKLLENQSYVKDVEIQYSGNRGFYVWGYLASKLDVDEAREKLKLLLGSTNKMNGVAVTLRQSPGKKTVRLDLSPMKNLGPLKAEGSLDYRTGLISTKLPVSQLDSFDPLKDASIDKYTLKPAYSFRDEELV